MIKILAKSYRAVRNIAESVLGTIIVIGLIGGAFLMSWNSKQTTAYEKANPCLFEEQLPTKPYGRNNLTPLRDELTHNIGDLHSEDSFGQAGTWFGSVYHNDPIDHYDTLIQNIEAKGFLKLSEGRYCADEVEIVVARDKENRLLLMDFLWGLDKQCRIIYMQQNPPPLYQYCNYVSQEEANKDTPPKASDLMPPKNDIIPTQAELTAVIDEVTNASGYFIDGFDENHSRSVSRSLKHDIRHAVSQDAKSKSLIKIQATAHRDTYCKGEIQIELGKDFAISTKENPFFIKASWSPTNKCRKY